MPAAAIAWLVAHQAIAAGLAAWLGLTAAGIDVTAKAIELKDSIAAESLKAQQPALPQK